MIKKLHYVSGGGLIVSLSEAGGNETGISVRRTNSVCEELCVERLLSCLTLMSW